EQTCLQAQRNTIFLQVRADGEIDDRPRLDPVRIEGRSAVYDDEWRGECVVGILKQRCRIGIRHQAGVVANARACPETRLTDVVNERSLRLQLLVVVDQERAAGDGIQRSLIQEQSTCKGRHINRACMSYRSEAAQARGARQIETNVPAVVVA